MARLELADRVWRAVDAAVVERRARPWWRLGLADRVWRAVDAAVVERRAQP